MDEATEAGEVKRANERRGNTGKKAQYEPEEAEGVARADNDSWR
jgi:hypothetical protein